MDQKTRDDHIARVQQTGFTIVENAIEPALIDALNAGLDRLERELDAKPAMNGFEGHKTVRIYNLLAFGDPFTRVPVHDNVLPVIEGVLDPGCLISSLSSIAIDPGEQHADEPIVAEAGSRDRSAPSPHRPCRWHAPVTRCFPASRTLIQPDRRRAVPRPRTRAT